MVKHDAIIVDAHVTQQERRSNRVVAIGHYTSLMAKSCCLAKRIEKKGELYFL
jgi:hypothetical protein